MRIETPYLLFLGDSADPIDAKTARGIHLWRPEVCAGELALPGGPSLGLPAMSPAEAVGAGARTLVLGTVNAGGFLPDAWIDVLVEGLEAGLDLAAGMHKRLSSIEALRRAAEAHGRRLIDVREPGRSFPVGTGVERAGKRVLTVGTDCSVGKMYTALALERDLRARGVNACFKATGQTGILIAGEGVPIDAVVSDFISGAVETLSPDAPGEWHLIEGQGSLFHPAYAGVTLGLIHGAQPDWLVVCHDPSRPHMRHVPHLELPSLARTMAACLEAATLTNPAVRCLGFALNTSRMAETAARDLLASIEREHGLPATDPVRFGVATLGQRLLAEEGIG
ncbi:MAG TPA: N-acetyltransferase DgcN [Thermoanaerobaculia bacterium]|nr:N-acetyltransferase DgcN [Thermoanaerobaculia bacterium]